MRGFAEQFDDFHTAAAEATGLDDFGPADYRDPLQVLLYDYDRHGRMSEVGRKITAAEVIGKLIGRLVAEDGLKRSPEWRRPVIERPLIIVGMGRTGTTTLHRLFAQDPATQALELWLGMRPMPRPPRETWESLPAYRQVARQIASLHAGAPGLQQVHPIYADRPDECKFAFDQSFYSPTMATLSTVPDYRAWLLATEPDLAYARYRELLGLISGGDNRRWILKNPDHIFGLDSLLKAFPDACIVQTHRDPLIATTSLASVSYMMRRMREPACTPMEHGNDMRAWLLALEKAEIARARHDPARFFDLHIRELSADPAGSVERIYNHFDLAISAEARAAWRSSATQDPRGGHGTHDYSAVDFGLSHADVAALAPNYLARYQQCYGHFDNSTVSLQSTP